MKKILSLVLFIIIFALPSHKAHALDPKVKAFAIITTYGTVGGALLGFASLAFQDNSRVVAQGASLGLYAGIAFGAYVITSHRNSRNQPYQDSYQPPARDDNPPPGYDSGFGDDGGGGGFGAPVPREEDRGGFFGSGQRTLEVRQDNYRNFKYKKGRGNSLPFYMNLMSLTF